jgi:hypothetical protein
MRGSLSRPFLLLTFCFSLAYGSQGPRDPNALQPGTSISRTVARGQSHQFSIVMEKDQCAQVVVDQRGIDLIVRVYTPNRGNVVEFDSPNGANGAENAKVVALTSGTYIVEVSPLSQLQSTNGQFEIRLTEVRGATEPELQIARRPEILRTKGIALLTTLADMLPEVRSAPTRIRYQMQVAQLLWPFNEQASRKLAMDAMAGVREFLDRDVPEDADQNDRYYTPSQLRQEVFSMLVQQDPELALNFLRATAGNAAQPQQEIQSEMQVANSLASKNSRRAFEIAQDVLSRGYPNQLGNVINSIRASEPLMAARLMKDAVAKLQEEKLLATPEAANLAVNLLQVARSQPPRNPTPPGTIAIPDMPLLPQAEYRALLSKALDEGLSAEFIPNTYSPEMNAARSILNSMKSMSEDIRSIAPGKIAALEEKLAQMNAQQGNPRDRIYREAINTSPVEVALDMIARAPQDLRDNLYQQIATKVANTDVFRARQIVTTFMVNPQQRQMALDGVERQAVQNAINAGKLDEALDRIRDVKLRTERINMISQLINRVGQGHKADAVVNLLEQLRNLVTVSPRPEDQSQLNALIQIAGMFSKYNPEKGFHIVEPLVDHFNDLAMAARALNGFGQQYYQNGELSLNNGNALGNIASQFNQALARLATADFDRAKNLVDRMQRPEVRAAAYLAMAQQAINANGQVGYTLGGIRIMTR